MICIKDKIKLLIITCALSVSSFAFAGAMPVISQDACKPSRDYCVQIKGDSSIPDTDPIDVTVLLRFFADGKDNIGGEEIPISQTLSRYYSFDMSSFKDNLKFVLVYVAGANGKKFDNCLIYADQDPIQPGVHTITLSKSGNEVSCKTQW